MPRFEFKIESKDGLALHGRGWRPDAEARAVICLVHGLGEHSGRYGHMGEAFNHAGYALMTFDLRGHGRSDGSRGHAPNYAALMTDISALLNEVKLHYPSLPRFLYGHSLGGNLVIHYALREHPNLAGIIASAPLLRTASKPPTWKLAMLRAMVGVWPSLSIPNGLETSALSRDPKVVLAYQNDPLTHDRISARLAMNMLRYGQWNLEHAAEFPLPLLLMHGDADRITSAQASRDFAAQANTRCTLKIWNGLYHELHNEPEQNQVLDDILEWLETHATKTLHS